MKVALITSRQDKAGLNIRQHIEQLLDDEPGLWKELDRSYTFFDVDERLIHAEGVDQNIDADLVIFLSRHASINPVPVLTVHVTGNFREGELGGIARTLSPAAPAMMQATLRALVRHCPEGYRVSYEVTHHGPTAIRLPSFFVEIGSTEKEWIDPEAGRAVAESVLSAAPINAIPLIGFGGTHYATRQTEIAISSRGAFGHIAHTREIATLDKGMIQTMTRQSNAVAAYIDRKALDRNDYTRLAALIDTLAIPRLSESEIGAVGHLSWEVYQEVRKMAGQFGPQTRCYPHDIHGKGNLVAVQLNPVLLTETVKTDERSLIKDLDNLPVVHLSTQDNRLLPSFITFEEHSSQIINALNTLCVKIIRNKEITAIERDHLIITRKRFDPHKARKLGIQPGPSYKLLAEGRETEINGKVITPEMVAASSTIKIHIPGLEKYS